MQNKKTLVVIIVIIMIMIIGLGIYFIKKSDSKSNAATNNPTLILLTEEYPPITYMGSDGKVTGIATDTVTEIMKRLNVNYEIKLLKWDDAYSQALSSPNVVLFSTERTEKRENLFNWVGPLGNNKIYFYANKNSGLEINSLDDAKKVAKIATCSSWFTEQYLKDQGFTNLESYTDPKDDITKLVGGNVDLSVFTDMTVGNLVKDAGYSASDIKPLYQLMETQFYIAISKGTSQDIVNKWQNAFEDIKEDGTLAKIYQKYVPDIEPPR
jgi:polar amino acid transport system substrate-binding protein